MQSGIIKKVADQVGYWTSQGHDVSVFMPWPKPTSESVLLINGIVLSARWVEGLPDGGVKNFANKVLCANRLRRALNELKPNILYIRQNMHFPGLSRMLKEHTTVLELNTVDVIEIGFHPFLRRKVYLSGRDKVLRAARGLVAVSPDILKHYATYGHLKTVVVSNGINLSRIPEGKKLPQTSEGTKLVFVGANSRPWLGLDKIFELATALPECSFSIVGSQPADDLARPGNVRLLGWADQATLEKIYAQHHFGIGSFSNHLVGKRVDSTLKVREYLAYGLPVILGHWDVDFKDADFVFKATNEENELLDVSVIRRFIEQYKNYVVRRNDIAMIDSAAKEEERLSFFSELSRR